VIDELDVLGEIVGLKNALARLRKCGGPCVPGFQSIFLELYTLNSELFRLFPKSITFNI
jgi:Type IV secretion-system coupling protein DNA-binding domain